MLKYLQTKEHPYPHIGNMLSTILERRRLPKAWLARQLDVTGPGVLRYTEHPSIQVGILWKAGIALEHNFFEELSEQFPYRNVAQEDASKESEEIAALKSHISDLEKELAIYKEIVYRK